MTVRRRIFLAALAVGVVGTLVVLIWSAGPKETKPKLWVGFDGYAFRQIAYTTNLTKDVVIKVTNRGTNALNITAIGVVNEKKKPEKFPVWLGRPMILAGDETHRMGFSIEEGSRCRGCCWVERNSLSNKLRQKLHQLPLIGRHVYPYDEYLVMSDWFNQ